MHYLWLDLETTGLDPEVHSIVEIAAILTDEDLKEIGRLEHVIRTNDAYWNTYCVGLHARNGLSALVPEGTPLSKVAIEIYSLVAGYEKIRLAGNSPHFDRSFIERIFPSLHENLSLRHFDISVLRDLVPKWWPELDIVTEENSPTVHRAMPDIERALMTARLMQDHFMSKGGKGF